MRKRAISIFIVLIVAVLLYWAYDGKNRASDVTEIGGSYRVSTSGTTSTFFAFQDEDAFDDFNKAINANDQFAYDTLVLDGKVQVLDNGTVVVILANNYLWRLADVVEVRVVNGSRPGDALYLPIRFDDITLTPLATAQ